MTDGNRSKYRNWCFTAYIPPKKDIECSYIIYQKEICPSTEKVHWQGYVEFKNQKRMSEVKKAFDDNTLHLECRHGTQEQAIEYCKKKESNAGEDPIEFGTPKRQGNRSDLQSIYESIESGATTKEILSEFGGHALRYIVNIQRGVAVVNGYDPIDRQILENRRIAEHLNGTRHINDS